LLVEAFFGNQSNALLKATLLELYPIQVERHASLNSSTGVISTDALDGLSYEAIQSFLADLSVSRACRLIGKRDDKLFPLRTVFLTFEVPDLPSHVYLDYERVPVRAYVPNPMRCFRYQKFGHTQQRCTSDIVCGNCGEAGNGDSPCTNPSRCVNCQGNHHSNSKKFPIFLKEKDIQELRVKEGLSFPEARKRYEERCPKVTQPLLSAVVEKSALALQLRQRLVLFRLLAPSPIPPKR
jgi:hypothetical protein